MEESRFAPFPNPALSSTSYVTWFNSVGSYPTELGGLALSSDGKKLYFSSTRDKLIYQAELTSKDDLTNVYYLTNPWNVTGLYPTQSLTTALTNLHDISFKPGGGAFTIISNEATGGNVSTFYTSSSYNVGTATFNTANTLPGIFLNSLTGLHFGNRGRKVFFKAGDPVGNNDTVFSYDVKSPYLFYELVGFGGGGGVPGYSRTGGTYIGGGGGSGGIGAAGGADAGAGGGGAGGYSGDGRYRDWETIGRAHV